MASGSTSGGSTYQVLVVNSVNYPARTVYDIRPSGKESNSYNTVNLNGFIFTITNNSSKKLTLKSLQILIGNQVYYISTFSSSTLAISASVNVQVNPSIASATTNDVFFSSEQNQNIIVVINSTDGTNYYTTTHDLGITLSFVSPYLSNIYIKQMPNNLWFYKNATFNYDGLSVYGKWLYQQEGTVYKDSAVNFTISKPDMTTLGQKRITISYDGKYVYYNISVYGVIKVEPTTRATFNYRYKQPLDTSNFCNAKIYYDGGDFTSREIPSSEISWSGYNPNREDEEIQTITGTFVDEYTQETFSITADVRVYMCYRIFISKEATTKTFYTNDTFNASGLQITADYSDVGKFLLNSSDYSISIPDMTSAGSKTITITYAESPNNIKTVSYSISVIGLTNIQIDTSNVKTYYLKNEIINTNNLLVTANLSNGTSFICNNDDLVIDTSNFKFNQVGQYDIIVKYTYKGITKTASYQVSVDALTQLTLSNYKSIFYVMNNIIPSFDAGDILVKAYFNYAAPRELASSEYIINVLEPLQIGEQQVEVVATLGDTKSANYTISVVEDYPISLGSKGIVVNNDLLIFQNGETFNTKGITVYCDMASGSKNISVNFTVPAYTNHVFSDNDASGEISTNVVVEGLGVVGKITIYHKVISSFTITKQPNKTRYKVGEIVDLTGTIGKITYNDGTTQEVNTFTTSKTTAFTFDDVGEFILDVVFANKIATITLNIVCVESIVIDNYNKQYIRHESLDTSNWIVEKHYTDDVIEYTDTKNESLVFSNSVSEINLLEPDEGKTYKTITVLYQASDGNVSLNLQISVLALQSISLYDNQEVFTNKVIDYGNAFSITGMVLKVNYNDSNYDEQIVLSDENIITKNIILHNFTNNQTIYSKLPTCFIGINFGGEEKLTSSFSIDCKYLSQIIATTSEEFNNKSWYVGDTFSIDGISVNAKYVDTANKTYPLIDITNECVFQPSNNSILQYSGTNNILISYTIGENYNIQSKNTTINIQVSDVELEDLTVDLTLLAKPLSSYVEGQRLNLNGISIQAIFNKTSNNKVLDIIDCSFYIGGLNESNKISYTETMYVSKHNNQTLYVSYTYNNTRINKVVGTLTVIAKQLESIAIAPSSQYKTNYLFGDVFTREGLIIAVTYNDGSPTQNINTGFTTDYDNKTDIFTKEDEGQKTVTISYQEGDIVKTTSYIITIAAPSMTALSFDTSLIVLSVRNQTEYSIDGLIVYGVFENGYKEKLLSWQSDVQTVLNIQEGVVNLLPSELGVKNITISATNPYKESEGISAKLQVSVTPNATLTGIRLVFDNDVDYDEYYVGDTFDAKGLKVYATYQDIADQTEVKGFTTNPSINSILRKGGRFTVEVSFTDTGKTYTASYNIIVSMPFDSGTTTTTIYKIVFNVEELQVDEVLLNKDSLGFDLLPLYDSNYVNVDTDISSPTYGKNILTDLSKKDEAVGYLDLGSQDETTGYTIKNAHVVFFEDIVNPIEGGNNITVKFPHYVEGNANKIDRCTFGILFGHNNSKNRLFVSGNPDYNNKDWYSGQLDSEFVSSPEFVNGNFGYFEFGSERSYGETDNSIIGYDIVSDDKMLVLKSKSDKETSVYFRKPSLLTAINTSGTVVNDLQDSTLYEEEFAISKGNNTVSGISPYSIINFNGDSLFVSSDNQLVGLDLTGITGDNQRYANTRSYYIDADLKNQDLTNCFLWSNNKYLFLVLLNKIYIAHHELITNNQYEWFVIDVANVSSIIEIDNEIFFGRTDGTFAKFVDKTYEDITNIFIKNNARVVSINDNIYIQIPTDELNKIRDDGQYLVSVIDEPTQVDSNKITSMFYEVATIGTDFICDVGNNVIKLVCNDLEKIVKISKYIGDKNSFYLEMVNKNDDLPIITNNYNKPFTLKRVENKDITDGDYYEVYTYNNQRVNVDSIENTKLCLKVESDLEIANIDRENSCFQLALNGEPINIILYGNQQLDSIFQINISESKPVEAFYITIPIKMGNLENFKTIWSFTITNDTNIPSELELCYSSNKIPLETMKTLAKISKDVLGFDLDSFNFDKVDFDKNIVPRTYTNKRILSNVKFVCFAFRNYNKSNAVLSTMVITYTIPYPSYGSN